MQPQRELSIKEASCAKRLILLKSIDITLWSELVRLDMLRSVTESKQDIQRAVFRVELERRIGVNTKIGHIYIYIFLCN